MEYTQPLRDFTLRTIENVEIIRTEHEQHKLRGESEAPFVVTAQLGAFVSIIVLLRNDLEQLIWDHPTPLRVLTEALAALSVTKGEHWKSRDQIRAFRNAFGHGHLSVESDHAKRIGTIRLRHEKDSWEAVLDEAQLQEALGLLKAFAEALPA